MGMVVQHNLTAMNSNRMLGVTSSAQAKSTEKLSSGYKINRAADDAAGLSISEKMRKQIRGLTQASANAQDGISAVQTAEGALTEVHDMLQRMNELAVKAANGTNSESDRSYIQNEIDQLVTEIDRVAETTKFNETYLLKGNSNAKSSATQTQLAVGDAFDLDLATGVNTVLADYSVGTVTISNATKAVNGGALGTPAVNADNDTLKQLMNQSESGKLVFTAANAEETVAGTNQFNNAKAVWSISDGTNSILLGDKNSWTTDELASLGISVGSKALETTAAVGDKITNGNTFTVTKNLVTSGTQVANLAAAGVAGATAGSDNEDATLTLIKDIDVGNDLKVTIKADNNGEGVLTAYDNAAVPNALDLSLHVGADSTTNNKISLEITSMSAKGLGLRTTTGEALKVDGKDSTNADNAIDTIAAAIQKVSTQRSALGAVQNRLEHTINNLDNVVENTTSAESAIRDTDMATEMVKYSNNNILAQAGTSMLAQANQANQNILSLLG